MISGAHVIIYSRDAEADRAFIRDVLGFAYVDAGDGWLIFKLPPAEVAVHPSGDEPRQEFHLMCDDVMATRATLTAKGVAVSSVTEAPWGSRVLVTLPSGAELSIYQPRHAVAYGLGD